MDFEMDNEFNDVTNIKVIGVGGAAEMLSTVWQTMISAEFSL